MRNLWLRNNTTIAIHRFRTGIDDTRIRGRIIKTGIYWLWTTITAHRWHFSKTGIHWLLTSITHRWQISKTGVHLLRTTTAHRWHFSITGIHWLLTSITYRWQISKTGVHLLRTTTAHRWHFSKTGIHWLWTTITAHRWNLSKTCIPTTAHRWRNLWLIEGIIIFGGLWMVTFKCLWRIHYSITICNWHRQIHHWLISYSSHGFLTLTLHHLLWGKLFQLFLYQCCRLF